MTSSKHMKNPQNDPSDSQDFIVVSKQGVTPQTSDKVTPTEGDTSIFPLSEKDINSGTQTTSSFSPQDVSVESNETRNIFSHEYSMLRGLSFWSKFLGIVTLIGAIGNIILGIPALIFFGVGLLYIGIGVVGIIIALQYLSAAKHAKAMTEAHDRDETFQLSLMTLGKFKNIVKINGIITLVLWFLILLAIIFVTLFLPNVQTDFRDVLQSEINQSEMNNSDLSELYKLFSTPSTDTQTDEDTNVSQQQSQSQSQINQEELLQNFLNTLQKDTNTN